MRLIPALAVAGVLLAGAAVADRARAPARRRPAHRHERHPRRDHARRAGRQAHDRRFGGGRDRRQEGSPRRPLLGRKHHEELRGDGRHAARRRAQARSGRPCQHAPPGTPSRGSADPASESAQPHERHSGLHGARAVDERRRAQPTRRHLPAAARLVRRQAPARVPARKPRVLLEHELSRARGDPPAGHRPVAGHPAAGTNLRAARPHGNRLRERTPNLRQRPAARLRRLRVAAHRRLAARPRRALGRRCDRLERARPGGVLRRAAARTARPAATRRRDGEDRSPARTARGWGCTGSRRRAAAGSTGTRAARPATSRSPRARETGAASSWSTGPGSAATPSPRWTSTSTTSSCRSSTSLVLGGAESMWPSWSQAGRVEDQVDDDRGPAGRVRGTSPAPLSAWKYSLKVRLSFHLGSLCSRSTPPWTRRRRRAPAARSRRSGLRGPARSPRGSAPRRADGISRVNGSPESAGSGRTAESPGSWGQRADRAAPVRRAAERVPHGRGAAGSSSIVGAGDCP